MVAMHTDQGYRYYANWIITI